MDRELLIKVNTLAGIIRSGESKAVKDGKISAPPMLDTTMTASVLATLQQGITCSTVEIKTNFIRPVAAQTGVLRCEARPIHIGKRRATVEGHLKDRKGRLAVYGTPTCSIFKVRTVKASQRSTRPGSRIPQSSKKSNPRRGSCGRRLSVAGGK